MISIHFLPQTQMHLCKSMLGVDGPFKITKVNLQCLKEEMGRVGGEKVSQRYLTTEERNTFLGYKFHKRKVEWLAGRIAAKYAVLALLAEHEIFTEEDNLNFLKISIDVEASGRPYVRCEDHSVEISISHSGNAAVAMALFQKPCGIDIQKISSQVVKVQSKFVSSPELQLITEKSGIDLSCTEALTLLWSAKEAIRKGLQIKPLAGFLELQLVEVIPSEEGVLFKFDLPRLVEQSYYKGRLSTYQLLNADSAFAVFVMPEMEVAV